MLNRGWTTRTAQTASAMGEHKRKKARDLHASLVTFPLFTDSLRHVICSGNWEKSAHVRDAQGFESRIMRQHVVQHEQCDSHRANLDCRWRLTAA